MERPCQEDNLSFIQAILQLKSAVKIGSSLPLDALNDIAVEFPEECKRTLPIYLQSDKNENSREVQCTSSQEFIDSGVGSSATEDAGDHVSSTTISYLIQSPIIGSHLHQSVISVTDYLFSSLFSVSDEMLQKYINNWKGSHFELTVNVIVELMDLTSCSENNECTKTCCEFITKAINNIFQARNTNLYSVLEYQCVIISELGNSHYLCEVAIHCIMKIIEEMTSKMKMNGLNAKSLCKVETTVIGSQEFDTSFFILNLLERLLKKWTDHCVAVTQTEHYKKAAHINITEMWKRSWGSTENTDNERKNMKTLQEKWSNTLENVMNITMDVYPNFSFVAWMCFQILESLGSHL